MKKFRLSHLYIAIAIRVISLDAGAQPSAVVHEPQPLPYHLYSHWVDSVFNSLTPDERIAQMIIIPAWSNRDQKHIDEVAALVKNYHVGGVVFFQGGPIRQAQQTNYYQWVAKTPLFISIDGEWGLGMRLDSTISFPRQMMLGAVADNDLIYRMGCEVANELKALGININFAPVVDVNNNPGNPVISNRSFGENKVLVAEKGIAYMKGMQDCGILTTAKHFPGHGDTNEDSHLALPVLNFGMQRLDSIELYPFRQLIKNNVGGIMVAHLHVPSLDSGKNIPTTLSYNAVTELLKKKMGYNGLVFTDALNMRGATVSLRPGEVDVRAVEAGNDVLLMPNDVPKALRAIREAIDEGCIRQSQIDSSCRKILAAKEWAGLNKMKPVDISTVKEKLNPLSAQLIQREFASSGLTLIQNQNNILPLKKLDTLRMAVVLVGIDKPNQFRETLSLYKDMDCYFLPKHADTAYIDSVLLCLRHYNLVIVGIHNTDSRPTQNFGIASNVSPFLSKLVKSKNAILTLFGSPYALNQFKDLNRYKAILVSYHDQTAIQDYSAQLIFGAIGAKGKLPVSVAGYPVTTGLTTAGGLRLRYALPEEIGIDSHKLADIDTIVAEAIRRKAMPGCQVLAAKNGVVFYNKSFGFQTYDNTRPVRNDDLYDIASVTKIAGTMPAVMKLYEEKKLDVHAKLSDYLTDMKKSNKKNIVLLDMLTHQAQLQPFIPFYLRTIEAVPLKEQLLSNAASDTYPSSRPAPSPASKSYKYREGLYTSSPDLEHGLEVADHLFLMSSYTDSIYQISKDSKLLPVKKYEYSDMDFYYLFWIVEHLTQQPMNEYVQTNFYNKLGATTLGYLPINRFDIDRIAPTENDQVFRKQVVHGFVHDPGAAMMGGVCGHAGLFSSSNDLAKLMQMYLNKGTYGGEQYFKESTIDYFTSCPFCGQHNRRGIGFDKPEMNAKVGPTCQCVSAKSFGHQGFTGCMTWADPETGLLYIFLSNRVYPDASNVKLAEMNIRTRIQEVLAKATE